MLGRELIRRETPVLTVATQINEFLAPVQPDDCRQANLALLVNALRATGPIVHRGHVVSLAADGSVEFDASRPIEPIPASTTEDAEGNVTEIPARDPTDSELGERWGLPAACDTPLPVGEPAPSSAKPTSQEP